MKKLGRILVVLADNIIAIVLWPLYFTITFIVCAFIALIKRDVEWITIAWLPAMREGIVESIKTHGDFLKTGKV